MQKLPGMQEMQETGVRFLGREDPLEEEMATHSSILAWRIPWTEEPGGYSPRGGKESDTAEQQTNQQTHLTQSPLLSTVSQSGSH